MGAGIAQAVSDVVRAIHLRSDVLLDITVFSFLLRFQVAACFPDEVQSLVCIDMIKPISAKAVRICTLFFRSI